MHAIDLVKLGVDPDSERVVKLIHEASSHVISDSGYRVFAHCTEEGERYWHLFILFLSREWGWSPDHAAAHVENLSQKQSMDPDEWLGEEGARFRRGEPSEEFKQAWTAFKQTNAARSQAEIIAETEAIYSKQCEEATAPTAISQSSKRRPRTSRPRPRHSRKRGKRPAIVLTERD